MKNLFWKMREEFYQKGKRIRTIFLNVKIYFEDLTRLIFNFSRSFLDGNISGFCKMSKLYKRRKFHLKAQNEFLCTENANRSSIL